MTAVMATPLAAERRAAVIAALARIRKTAGSAAHPDAAAIAEIKAVTRALAAQRHLWERKDFPIAPGQVWGVYEVNEDADGRFALYASAAHPGHRQPPHNHTTWACIAGVRGIEVNRLFRRVKGGAEPGPAELEQTGELSLGQGDVFFLGPDDIHTIDIIQPDDAMHLHLYGLGFPHLDRRMRYDLQAGALRGTCNYFPVFSDIPKIPN